MGNSKTPELLVLVLFQYSDIFSYLHFIPFYPLPFLLFKNEKTMSKKKEWSNILTGIAGFDPIEGKAISGLNTAPKNLFTEAKNEKPTPTLQKLKPTLKKQSAKEERKITTARIDHRKLLLIKMIYSDVNAFEALDRVVDFWIENNEKEITTSFEKALSYLK